MAQTTKILRGELSTPMYDFESNMARKQKLYKKHTKILFRYNLLKLYLIKGNFNNHFIAQFTNSLNSKYKYRVF